MNMELNGLHHVTAVTAHAAENKRFYTEVLGLRLVKKSVNQDDVSAYHLFYADKKGSPGTDMTFFDWAQAEERYGETDGVHRTLFRVKTKEALAYWAARLTEFRIAHAGIEKLGDRDALLFEDFEGQRLGLVDDGGAPFEGEEWASVVPAEQAIRGFHAVQLAVPAEAPIRELFAKVLGFKESGSYVADGEDVTVYSMAAGGPGREVHLIERPGSRMWALAGGVHHVAFRVKDEGEIRAWWALLNQVGIGNSGLVERYYFKSLYFNVSPGILFELATDGPGFAVDEDEATLGERLALPPFLEDRREEIEAGLKPL